MLSVARPDDWQKSFFISHRVAFNKNRVAHNIDIGGAGESTSPQFVRRLLFRTYRSQILTCFLFFCWSNSRPTAGNFCEPLRHTGLHVTRTGLVQAHTGFQTDPHTTHTSPYRPIQAHKYRPCIPLVGPYRSQAPIHDRTGRTQAHTGPHSQNRPRTGPYRGHTGSCRPIQGRQLLSSLVTPRPLFQLLRLPPYLCPRSHPFHPSPSPPWDPATGIWQLQLPDPVAGSHLRVNSQ